MPKQLNVNLAFTADTSKAKQQIQDLQNSLSKLGSSSSNNFAKKWTEQMQEASFAALELKNHIQNATNVETGTLDFSRLNQSLKQGNKSLADYGMHLKSLGPEGQAAFSQLATAIAQSEIPLRRSNTALREMWVSLKNTARWQLSSSVLHGFIGAVQSAYGYAQDLNESLNNIRIVTGQNIDQMAKFAEQANKAARALSTTTTDYTNASLIFYQQGLSDAEVAKRTDVTVKMANAAGQSAQVVSDQLTAVWNNFYDGSKSLEYYADVMTALGAATASSTDEIAGGLEKFAAVADTIGLSYEYAAAALATITSNTRQSEDVVGTALRTIFARIQGLNLGETLDDGTTLNKYSQALAKIGVSVFDASGQLKDMDNILDEMAEKWDTLGKAEQTALAQTVAGVRQYTQLVALMDNWDAGDADSMVANLRTAYGSSGALDEQADIYAESWEAAQKRVKAAAQSIYNDLINDEMFISILNGFEDLLVMLDKTIDRMGGLKGVLSTLGVVVTKVFSQQIAGGLQDMAHNIYMSTEAGKQAAKNQKIQDLNELKDIMGVNAEGVDDSAAAGVAATQYKKQIDLQIQLIENAENMSESEIAHAQQLLDLRRQIADQVIKAAQTEENAKNNQLDLIDQARKEMYSSAAKSDLPFDMKALEKDFNNYQKELQETGTQIGNVKLALKQLGEDTKGNLDNNIIEQLQKFFSRTDIQNNLQISGDEIEEYFNKISMGGTEAKEALEELRKLLSGRSGTIQGQLSKSGSDVDTIRKLANSYEDVRVSAYEAKQGIETAAQAQEKIEQRIKNSKATMQDWSNKFVAAAQGALSLHSILSSFQSMLDTLSNPDATGWEKFSAVLQTTANTVIMLGSAIGSLSKAKGLLSKANLQNLASSALEIIAARAEKIAQQDAARAYKEKDEAVEKSSKNLQQHTAKTTASGFTTISHSQALQKNTNEFIENSIAIDANSKQLLENTGLTITNSVAKRGGSPKQQSLKQLTSGDISDLVEVTFGDQFLLGDGKGGSGMEAVDGTSLGVAGGPSAGASSGGGIVGSASRLTEAWKKALPVLQKYGKMAGSVAAIIAVVAVTVAATAAAYQKEQKALDEAIATQEKLETSYQNLKTTQEEFNSTVNSYESATQSLEELTKGTTEYSQVLMEANEYAMELIKNNSELATQYSIQDGQIVFDEGALDSVMQRQLEDLVQSQVNTLIGDNMVLEAENFLNDTELARDINSNFEGRGLWNVLGQTLAGAIIGAIAGGIPGAVAGAIGGAVTGVATADTLGSKTDAEMQALENIASYVKDTGDTSIFSSKMAFREFLRNGEIEGLNDSLIDALVKNTEAVKESTIKRIENEDTFDANIQSAILALNANNQDFQEHDNQTYLTNRVQDEFEGIEDYSSYVTETGEDLAEAYVRNYLGLDPNDKESVDIRRPGGNRVTIRTYNEEEEKWERQVLNYDKDIIPALGQQRALNAANENIGQFMEEYERMFDIFLEKGLSSDKIDEILNQISAEDGFDFSGLSWADLDAALGSIKEIKEELGPDFDTDAYIDAISKQQEVIREKFSQEQLDWFRNLSRRDQSLIMQIEIDKDWSIENLNQHLETLQDIANNRTIFYKLEAATELEDLIEAGSTDFETIYSLLAELLGQDELSAEQIVEFMTMSKEEQLNFISSAKSNMTDYLDWNQERQNQLTRDATQATEDRIAAENYLNNVIAENANEIETAQSMDATYTIATGNDPSNIFAGVKNENLTFSAADSEDGNDFLDVYNKLYNESSGAFDPNAIVNLGENALMEQWFQENASDDLKNASTDGTLQGAIDSISPEVRTALLQMIGNALNDGSLSDYLLNNYANLSEGAWLRGNEDYDIAKENYDNAVELENSANAEATGYAENRYLMENAYASEIENLGFDLDLYEETKRSILEGNEALEDQDDILHDLAKTQLRFNRGVETMVDSQKDWIKTLNSADKNSNEYLETVGEMRDAYADLFDLDPTTAEQLSSEFLTSAENIDLMTRALNGDQAAWDQWKANVVDALITNDIEGEIRGIGGSLSTLMKDIAAYDFEEAGIEIGASLDATPFWDVLSQMEIESPEAATRISNALSAIGVDAELEEHTVTVPADTKLTETNGYYPYFDGETVHQIPVSSTVVESEDAKTFSWYTIKGATYNGRGMAPPKPSSRGGGGGGGGGSKPKKTEFTKKSDVVDRYKEVNDKLDDVQDKMDDASKAADKLWGPNRIKQMQKVSDEMETQVKLLRQKRAEAVAYLKEDQDALQQAAKENKADLFQFDAAGNISNYEEVMTKMYNELHAAQVAAGPTTDDSEQEKIDAIQERIDKVKEAIEQYDETRELIEDLDNELDEAILAWQENNLETIRMELEIDLGVSEANLELIEYFISKTEDDFFEAAEAAALMSDKMEGNLDNLASYSQAYEDLVEKYTTLDETTGERGINQAQFIEELKELQSGLIDTLGSIEELDDAMLMYYGETLAAAGDELGKYTDLMEAHNDVLDHYSSLLELLGKSRDFERMGAVLEAQAQVAENAAEVSRKNYEMLAAQAAAREQELRDAEAAGLSGYARDVIKQEWLDAQNAANEAQDQMLSDAEAWAEALQAVLENELEGLADILQSALAGEFGDLDNMMNQMERANTLQEEYLTTTNKIYETDKLINKAQDEIDKTSNAVAKRRLKQFQDETEALQGQTKLSQYELEIQQAKYDLLLAEIALEEAQAAKSIVRLRRDNEGNFGYVYTADENAVAEAQQELEDAQNNLYNIGLEGANDYAEKYAETLQEMNDEITELTEMWQEGEIASKEEYQERVLALEDFYNQKLMQYSELRTVALATDSRVIEDAWTQSFAGMMDRTQDWMNAVDDYVSEVESSFNRYQEEMDKVEAETGMDLESLGDKTQDIVDASEELADVITRDNGLIDAMEEEINSVANLTAVYAELRKNIQGTIVDHEKLLNEVNKDINNESDDDTSNDRQPTNPPKPEPEPTPEPPAPAPEPAATVSTAKGYQTGILSWRGNGASRVWTDSAGNSYAANSPEGRAIQAAFNAAYKANGGYRGDYWVGSGRLNADILHQKYGLATGGYTGDWAGSYGKLAFLHQKELVLNAGDTENFLAGMNILDKIVSAIDLYSWNAQLGGMLNSPSYAGVTGGAPIEQNVHIEASFPNVSDRNEIEEAITNLVNRASQYSFR